MNNEDVATTESTTEELTPEQETNLDSIDNTQKYLQMVEELLTQQLIDFTEDQQKFESCSKDAAYWIDVRNNLLQEVNSSFLETEKIFKEYSLNYDEFPPEIQQVLNGSDNGLKIIQRMIGRLLEQAAPLSELSVLEDLPLLPDQTELLLAVENEQDREVAEKKLGKLLKDLGNQRWDVLSNGTNTVNSYRKEFIRFIEKRVLNIVDGIESGKNNSLSLIASFKDAYIDQSENLDIWFSTYSRLRDLLIQMLAKVHIFKMEVKIGTPIDYEKHEPFDVEVDESLKNEDIKELIRSGYEYIPEQNSRSVLRPAQVVVVKNLES